MRYSLISKETPLISNLSMIENISLIKEFHENLSLNNADALSLEYLKRINLQDIALKRLNQCSHSEIFYVMYIRALMTQDINVIIATPFSILTTFENIKTIIQNMLMLNDVNKNITILELESNQVHYKECPCNIIK